MASIVSALEDSAANSASSSTTEREYEHILQVLLEGDNIVVTSLRQNKVKTLRDLFDFLKDQGKVNALKAKTKKGAFVNVPQDRKVELGSIISFINDLQNSYGTISLSPYPIVSTTRNQFKMFVSMVEGSMSNMTPPGRIKLRSGVMQCHPLHQNRPLSLLRLISIV
jgi:hypothetical protein